jgi:hypothetical protein
MLVGILNDLHFKQQKYIKESKGRVQMKINLQ